jgi:hypothetical protein
MFKQTLFFRNSNLLAVFWFRVLSCPKPLKPYICVAGCVILMDRALLHQHFLPASAVTAHYQPAFTVQH